MITRTAAVDVKLTPEELAAEWWGMDQNEQAEFFNEVHRIAASNLHAQLLSVSECPLLTRGGRSVMCLIGEYSEEVLP